MLGGLLHQPHAIGLDGRRLGDFEHGHGAGVHTRSFWSISSPDEECRAGGLCPAHASAFFDRGKASRATGYGPSRFGLLDDLPVLCGVKSRCDKRRIVRSRSVPRRNFACASFSKRDASQGLLSIRLRPRGSIPLSTGSIPL